MSVPTEPGVYPFTDEHGTFYVLVARMGNPHAGELCLRGVWLDSELPVYADVDAFAGEWGPRIPPPERLAAMEELLTRDPTRGRYEGQCPFCDQDAGRVAIVSDSSDAVVAHARDCPWERVRRLRAQEKKGIAVTADQPTATGDRISTAALAAGKEKQDGT